MKDKSVNQIVQEIIDNPVEEMPAAIMDHIYMPGALINIMNGLSKHDTPCAFRFAAGCIRLLHAVLMEK